MAEQEPTHYDERRTERWHVGKETMCVYAITNKLNGKSYVGQTRGEARRRWSAHVSPGSGAGRSAIKAAILAYGCGAFEFRVVDIAESQEQLNHKEQFWIRHFGSLAPAGYNLEVGGNRTEVSAATKEKMRESATGRVLSAETRKKISEAGIGRRHSDESKQKMRERLAGRVHSTETRLKISITKRCVRPTKEQRIAQAVAQMRGRTIGCSNGEVYSSRLEATAATGASSAAIGNVASGRRKTANGLRFWFIEGGQRG